MSMLWAEDIKVPAPENEIPNVIETDEEAEGLDLSLEIWLMPNGPRPTETTLNLLEEFEKKNGIHVSLVFLDWGNAWGKINDILNGKLPPHVIQLGSTWTPYFADQGLLTNLSEHNDLINFSRFVDVLEQTTRLSSDNQNYAVPWFIDARILLANKAHLEMAQVDPSSLDTYEGFKAGIKKIQATQVQNPQGDLVDGFGFPGRNDWNIAHDVSPWIWNEGGEFIKKEHGVWQSGLMDANTIKGVRRYLSFALEGLVSKRSLTMNTNNIADRFNKGSQSLVIKTSETILQVEIDDSLGGLAQSQLAKDGLISLPIPKGTKGAFSFVGGSNLAIPKQHENDAAALELLLFLTQPNNLHNFALETGFLPSDRNVLTEWSWSPTYTPVVQAIRSGKTHPTIPEWGNLEGSVSELMSTLLSLCEHEELYSEKEFYDIMVRYHRQINIMLGVKTSTAPDFHEFVSYLDADIALAAKERGELKGSYTGWAIAGLVLAILVMITILARKEKEEEEIDEHFDHDIEEAHHLHDKPSTVKSPASPL
jgi:multiple sugar transport system substrate-binding protein